MIGRLIPKVPLPHVLLLASLFAAALLFYFLALDYYYVGRLTDDARHLLAAESLLESRYVDLTQPDEPPLLNQLPGYPLLLLPSVAAQSLRLAQWMNIFFMLGAIALLLSLFRKDGWPGFYAAALTALNVLSVLQATTVMAEASFLFFSVLTFFVLSPILEREDAPSLKEMLALSLLSAWCAWLRPQGAALLLATGLSLLMRWRRQGIMFLVLSGLFASIPYLRNAFVSGIPAGYFSELPTWGVGGGAQAWNLATVVVSNLLRYPFMIAGESMFGWVDPIPGWDSWSARAFSLAILALIGIGVSKAGGRRDRAVLLYLGLYIGLHLFWVNQFHRYLFPVLPFLYLFLLRAYALRPRLLHTLSIMTMALFLFLDMTLAVNAHIARPGENLLPSRTLAWIRGNTGEGVVLAARHREFFRYQTGRKVVPFLYVRDPDETFHALLKRRAAYVIDSVDEEVMPSVPLRRDALLKRIRLSRALLSDPVRFKKEFQSDGEPFVIYKVLRPARFGKGYRLLKDAREKIANGELERAYELLREAQRLKVPLVRLPFTLGTTTMLLGKTEEARPLLEEAVRREPGFETARRNLERLGQGVTSHGDPASVH